MKLQPQPQPQAEAQPAARNVLEKISSGLLAVLFIALPVFILPYLNLTFSYAKIGFITLLVFVAAALIIIKIINAKAINYPSWFYVAALSAVPLAYALSALFSQHLALGLIGQGAELDTFFIVAVGMLLSGLTAMLSKDKKQSIFLLTIAFSAVALIVSLFHLSRFIFGADLLSLGLFGAATANTVGSFGDLGIYAGLAVIISLVSLEFLKFGALMRAGFYLLIASALSVVAVANFDLIANLWGLGVPVSLAFLITLCALVVFVHKKVTGPKGVFPYVSFIVFIIFLICTVQAKTVANFLAPHTGITAAGTLDVRVAPADAGAVAGKVLKSGAKPALLGAGPNRYFAVWGSFKPADPSVAATPSTFRQSDFGLSFSYIATSLATEGIIGFLAWILFFGFIIYYIYRLFKKTITLKAEPLSAYSSAVASVATVYLWLVAALYTPGPVILFLAFFFTGLLFGRVMADGIIPVRRLTWEEAGYWKSFAAVFCLVICLAIVVATGYVWATKAVASSYAVRAVSMLQAVKTSASDAEKGKAISNVQDLMARAINLSQSGEYLRYYTEVSLIRPGQFLNGRTTPVQPSDLKEDVVTDINRAVAAASEAALRNDPADYRNWIELGKVYETATFLGATSTAGISAQSYTEAKRLNPTNPYPPFFLGRIFVYAKDLKLARQELSRALSIEPGFADAQALLNSISAGPAPAPAPAPTPSPAVASSKTEVKPPAKAPIKK